MHTSIYILFYRKPEIKRIDMGVSIQIDQEESLLNASILISHDSSCNYENIIKFLLYIIHTRKSYYVYISNFEMMLDHYANLMFIKSIQTLKIMITE